VQRLIDDTMAEASPGPAGGGGGGGGGEGGGGGGAVGAPPLPPRDGAAALRRVAGWLHINAMRSERLQFHLLCEQSLASVWRKAALTSATPPPYLP